MIELSHSPSAIGVSPSGVNRLCPRYLETGHYSRWPVEGRPRATTYHQDRYLRNLALRNHLSMARGLINYLQLTTEVRVSNQTVRKRLHDDVLHARRPATVPILTVALRTYRQNFAQNHNWTEILEKKSYDCKCEKV